MLDIMRRKKRLKIVLWLVIVSLALGMLLFFVPGSNIGGVAVDTLAATVDGQSISINDLATAYRRTLDNYKAGGAGDLDPEMLKRLGIPRQVLNSLISAKVVQVIAARVGLEVTADEIRMEIETHPNLQDRGSFIGVDRYKALLAANNISVAEFEEDVRYSILENKLREVITDSIDVSDSELRDDFSRTSQRTTVDYVALKLEDFKKRLKPSEADLQAYFNEHRDDYRIKEKRKAQYLLIPLAEVVRNVQVTEQEILQEWNLAPHEETVEVSHILFRVQDDSKDAEVKARAEAVLKRIKAGEDFTELAKKYSEDPGSAEQGGYLGIIHRGQTVRAFEDAAFSLNPGEVSDLVRTEFGYHIILVSQKNTPTLESSRSSLVTTIRQRKAQDLAKKKAEEAAGLAETQNDLNIVAKDVDSGAEVQETDLFSNNENAFALGISQELMTEIFQLREIGSIGEPVEHPLGYAIPKLVEVQMAKPGDLATARDRVLEDYLEAKAKEQMETEAKKLSEEAVRQKSLENAATSMGLSVSTSQEFKFSEPAAPEIGTNSAFNTAAFDLKPGAVSEPIPISDGTAVLQVKSRSPFDEAAFEKEKAGIRERLLQSERDPYFQEYVQEIRGKLEKEGKIRVNAKALEQLEKSS